VQIVDTGGIGIVDTDDLEEHIEVQISVAIEEADVVLLLVDARHGLHPLDEAIAQRLRAAGKRTVLVANKCDTRAQELATADFFRLGWGEPLQTVATERRGRAELLGRVLDELADVPALEAPAKATMKIAFTGRRNVGKSTLLNTLAGQSRVIVSDVPGTTRDAVDVLFDYRGTRFVGIDTAGMRKERQVRDDIEYYSMHRSLEAIRRADVVLHLIDAPSELSQVDKKLASTVQELYKPCVLVVNKMDLVPEVEPGEFVEYLRAELPWFRFAPVALISALTGSNINYVIEAASLLFEQARLRVPTAELNVALEEAVTKRRPPRMKGRLMKLYYGTQVGVQPPTFALFVNEPKAFDDSYLRYLQGEMQRRLPFSHVPLKFYIRARRRRETAGRGSRRRGRGHG
jgi:GTP-binding protein